MQVAAANVLHQSVMGLFYKWRIAGTMLYWNITYIHHPPDQFVPLWEVLDKRYQNWTTTQTQVAFLANELIEKP